MNNFSSFNDNLDDFIDERAKEAIFNLRKNNKEYIKKKQEFESLYYKLSQELEPSQKSDFEKSIDTLNSMSSDELLEVYKTAMNDFLFKFKDDKNSK